MRDSQLVKASDKLFFNYLKKFLIFLLVWNATAIIFAILDLMTEASSSTFPSSFGDYLRGDLFLVLVQGNFSNPYEFHSEVPALRNQPYLPLPFLLIHFFGIHISSFNQNSLWVHLTVFTFFICLVFALLRMMSNAPKSIVVLVIVSLGLLSPTSMYLFTTGNIQTLIIAACLMAYSYQRSELRSKVLYFLSNLVIASTKPQFVVVNFARGLASSAYLYLYTASIFLGGIIAIFGLWFFDGKFASNLTYWLSSLRGCVNASPEYVVHNNASIIGNLSSLELFFFPNRIDNLFAIKFSTLIVVALFIYQLYLFYTAFEIEGAYWLQLWILVTIATLLIPVSYSYNLVLYILPICSLISSSADRRRFTERIVLSKFYSWVFYSMIFLVFATKPLHVWLVEGRADTNLYNMINALSLLAFIAIHRRIIRTK